jgi:hypothetical protein
MGICCDGGSLWRGFCVTDILRFGHFAFPTLSVAEILHDGGSP